jgi:hypothetical protein
MNSAFLFHLRQVRQAHDRARGNPIAVYRGANTVSALQAGPWKQPDGMNPYVYQLTEARDAAAWDLPVTENIERWVVRYAGPLTASDAPLDVPWWLQFQHGGTLTQCKAVQRRETSLPNALDNGYEILLERYPQ